MPVFIESSEAAGDWPAGGAHKWWLHHSLLSLQRSLARHRLRLILRTGNPLDALQALVAETGAVAVYGHRSYVPAGRAIDTRVERALEAAGVEVILFESYLLHDPDAVRTGAGDPYRVFTPFWKKLAAELVVPGPLPAPAFESGHVPETWPASVPLERLALEPRVDWAGGIARAWTPGEAAAERRLDHFADALLPAYLVQRDRPDCDGTSRLSPHLHFGEISIRTVWHRIRRRATGAVTEGPAGAFLRELAWREFSYHLLYHFPETPSRNFRDPFDRFPWRTDDGALACWQKGRTGYPIVDAGMRQLWTTGWMHHRVRMIVASFLTKHLLIHWHHGARWFWDTLVDADLANNTMGWQWSAGPGADAQPFFRIFNPITQGERFDPDGAYVRRWIPGLEELPARFVHRPWDAPAPPAGYPEPVVDHATARERALHAYRTLPRACPPRPSRAGRSLAGARANARNSRHFNGSSQSHRTVTSKEGRGNEGCRTTGTKKKSRGTSSGIPLSLADQFFELSDVRLVDRIQRTVFFHVDHLFVGATIKRERFRPTLSPHSPV